MISRTALLRCSLLLAAACGAPPDLRDCAEDRECGAGAVCVAGACAVNAPPVATVTVPEAATTHRVLRVDAASDDPEGRPVEHRWAVRPVAGGCVPEPDPTTGPRLELVAWCAGTYEVALTPIDDQGLVGPTTTRALVVTAAEGAPWATAGAPLAAGHRCAGAPPACEAIAPDGEVAFQLTAAAVDPAGGPLEYSWAAFPPEPPAGAVAPVAAFLQDASGPAPRVVLQSSGGPIAGTWRFRVRAANAEGLIGQAWQEIAVANQPPEVPGTPIQIAHRFAGGRFVARATIGGVGVDPDGDPLALSAALAGEPAPGCSERVEPSAPDQVAVAIDCGEASSLIGATERAIRITVEDPNGGFTEALVPLLVGNRPPLVLASPAFPDGAIAVDHGVAPCRVEPDRGDCFVAEAVDPFVAVDPDGDPLSPLTLGVGVAAGPTSARGIASWDGAALRAHMEAPVGLPGEFRSVDGASPFRLVPSVRDPWTASAAAAVPVTIRNRPPIVEAPLPVASIPHRYEASAARYAAYGSLARLADPDGDPLVPVFDAAASLPAGTPCDGLAFVDGVATLACEVRWALADGGRPPLARIAGVHHLAYGATDGWERTVTSTQVEVLDTPTQGGTFTGPVEACVCFTFLPFLGDCAEGVYRLASAGIPVPFPVEDADGDPVGITLAPTPASLGITPPTHCLPGRCTGRADPLDVRSFTVTATADSGSAAPVTIRSTTSPVCTAAGSCCTP